MQTILNVIVPIFGVVFVGYAIARARLLSADQGDALAKYVFVVAVPMLLFRTVVTADFDEANPFSIWTIYFGAVAVVWTAGTLLIRWFAKADRRKSVIAGISASFTNTVFVAIPAVERAYGDTGLHPLFLIISIHMPVMMLASTLLIERAAVLDAHEAGTAMEASTPRETLVRILKRLASNALIIGILCGFLWRLSGQPLPGLLNEVTRSLATTAGPVALFALGMSLDRYAIRGDLLPPLICSALSLVALPAMVYLFGVLVLPPLWLKVAVLTAACPAGVNSYVLATFFGSGERLAATTILLTTLLSVVTLTFWLSVLG
ncbi:AEC family transporter [Consotaella aegiceratis]|uniref:AEC family transporter n=1 Tax=Consotaella aegiceratis TaxID=3097961 RepID=UPI002F3FC878